MIKIIYCDLSPGLHASAETAGRDTIISLLPGLTPEQRRAALRRIRHSGRMGHGPRVPDVQLRVALALDRIKAITRTGAAVVRLHPAGSTLPVLFLSTAAVVFVLMATVSIHVVPAPKSSDQTPVVGGLVPDPTSSAPQAGASAAPSAGVVGGLPRNGSQPSSGPSAAGGSAAAQGLPSAYTPGFTELGSFTGGAGTNVAGAGSAGSGSSGTSGGTTSSGSGSTTSGSGHGSSGSASGSGSTSGTGSSGAGIPATGASAGSGSGSSGSGSSGSSGSGSSGSSGTGSSGGSSASSGSGGGVCVTLLSVQACLGL